MAFYLLKISAGCNKKSHIRVDWEVLSRFIWAGPFREPFCSGRSIKAKIRDLQVRLLKEHYSSVLSHVRRVNIQSLNCSAIRAHNINSFAAECLCRSFGAQVLIDDNPRYALECAEDGMRVLLFDYDNSYPWCKTGVDQSHPLVTKVHNWQEVEQKLLSWVAPESWHSLSAVRSRTVISI
jgi:hypothetical protein